MTTGNGVPTATDSGEDMFVRGGSRQLRDIEELVHKLRIVTKQLAVSARPGAAPHAQPAARDEAGAPCGERKQ